MATKKANAGKETTVKQGSMVKVEYTGTLDDGTVFDSSTGHGAPFEFTVGCGQVLPAFEKAMLGMKIGEEKSVKLSVSEAYGEYDPQSIRKVPRNQLPKDQEPKPGMLLIVALPNGAQIPTKIVEVTEEFVSIDLNHPLAGKALNFKIKMLAVSNGKGTEKQHNHTHDCECGGKDC